MLSDASERHVGRCQNRCQPIIKVGSLLKEVLFLSIIDPGKECNRCPKGYKNHHELHGVKPPVRLRSILFSISPYIFMSLAS